MMNLRCPLQQAVARFAAVALHLQFRDFPWPASLGMMWTEEEVVQIGPCLGCQLPVYLARDRLEIFPAHYALREIGLIGDANDWNACIIERPDCLGRSGNKRDFVGRMHAPAFLVDDTVAVEEDR